MKHHSLPFVLCITILAVMMTACASQPSATPTPTATPHPPKTEEITFQSGSFRLVGDLRLPGGSGPYPVVVFVHGSGPTDRTVSGEYVPIMERMLRAGFATFSWDKPGTGESTGWIDPNYVFAQRAQILLDAIEVMRARGDIDPQRIGLWGISQAGWVMPLALTQTQDIAFMICVSCAGMSTDDQMVFHKTAWALCDEVPEEKVDQKTRLLAELDRARTYDTYEEYPHYREVLEALAGLVSAPIGQWPVLSEETWQKNPSDPEDLWNPIRVIERLKIPVLAIFGDRDRAGDPLQGAYDYRRALEHAGNPKSRVELFPRAHHTIGRSSETSCPADQLRFLEQYVKTLGYGSLSEAQEAVAKDPRLLGDFAAPGYLDLIEEWLRGLPR